MLNKVKVAKKISVHPSKIRVTWTIVELRRWNITISKINALFSISATVIQNHETQYAEHHQNTSSTKTSGNS